eukprot:2130856-Amphidinium_carterae.1
MAKKASVLPVFVWQSSQVKLLLRSSLGFQAVEALAEIEVLLKETVDELEIETARSGLEEAAEALEKAESKSAKLEVGVSVVSLKTPSCPSRVAVNIPHCNSCSTLCCRMFEQLATSNLCK